MNIARSRLLLSGAAALALVLQLGACSTYGGQVTNAPAPAGNQGPPLLTNGFSP